MVVDVQGAQVDPRQVGGLRRLPAECGEGIVKRSGDIAHIRLQIVTQGVEPGSPVAVGGDMGDQRRHGGRREPVAGLQRLQVAVARVRLGDKAIGPGKGRNIKAL